MVVFVRDVANCSKEADSKRFGMVTCWWSPGRGTTQIGSLCPCAQDPWWKLIRIFPLFPGFFCNVNDPPVMFPFPPGAWLWQDGGSSPERFSAMFASEGNPKQFLRKRMSFLTTSYDAGFRLVWSLKKIHFSRTPCRAMWHFSQLGSGLGRNMCQVKCLMAVSRMLLGFADILDSTLHLHRINQSATSQSSHYWHPLTTKYTCWMILAHFGTGSRSRSPASQWVCQSRGDRDIGRARRLWQLQVRRGA